ncbi:zinc ABC transporter ATP-binding protein AztA [Candidatus Symbiopectobacterium sp. NZEC135]|uniref:zinc ABC transporter ATP-binding protein AztA n=1 Tax=Candidatus Symbiopectobacterium sp. NZEC135 TaxID=2820471 RepID=UPI0022273CBB|nr:zinc ABC transporter ATP-binding protein AztA [Candidatus Symbiopectobacterium sp. NZEC135]MCW2481210.1 ABC transporter ATP-binding protein [Candidatus Symbiopectobacterium sp. NZEC135]
MIDASLQLNGLAFGYGRHPAIKSITGTIAAGSLTALIGANGSGKSTLLKGIAGILRPMAGTHTKALGVRVAYLPQTSELDRSFPACVGDLVALGLWSERGLLRRHRAQERQRRADALASVGLVGFENTPLTVLSGGQFQRALFARVIVQNAHIILLDEPFNAIDAETTRMMLSLIKHWHQQGRTVLVVIHDLNLVRCHFPETIVVDGELLAWGKTSAVLDTLASSLSTDTRCAVASGGMQ